MTAEKGAGTPAPFSFLEAVAVYCNGMRTDSGHPVRRRVIPILGGYLAAGWGLLQFVSWAADRYGYDPLAVDFLTATWLIFIPIVFFLAWRSPADEEPLLPAVEPEPGSVAVAPFANRSSNPEDAFLSDGITEEIIAALARVEGLHVAARSSSFAARNRDADARTIGRTLGVRHVLEGSVQRFGNQLRVSTQLVDARAGFQLWSGKWDAEMADVFTIEDAIASNVVQALRDVLSGGLVSSTPQVPRANLKAYEQYLRGRQFYHQTRKKSLGFAREMFRRAIELDPSYAHAHAALADSITLELMYFPNSTADIGEADAASTRALELSPDLAEAHSARACVLFLLRRLDEAEKEFNAAISINAQLFEAWYFYARMCFQMGRLEEAVGLFARASAVCEDYQASFFTAQTYEALGRAGEAAQAYAAALAVTEHYMELNPDDARAATMRSTALVRLGRTDEGLEWAARAMQIDPEDAGVRYNVACTYAVVGKVEPAIAALEDAVRVGFGNRDWLEHDPDLDALRSDDRFKSLIAQM